LLLTNSKTRQNIQKIKLYDVRTLAHWARADSAVASAALDVSLQASMSQVRQAYGISKNNQSINQSIMALMKYDNPGKHCN